MFRPSSLSILWVKFIYELNQHRWPNEVRDGSHNRLITKLELARIETLDVVVTILSEFLAVSSTIYSLSILVGLRNIVFQSYIVQCARLDRCTARRSKFTYSAGYAWTAWTSEGTPAPVRAAANPQRLERRVSLPVFTLTSIQIEVHKPSRMGATSTRAATSSQD